MKKIGRAGRGEKVHIVDCTTRQDDGSLIMGIYCGSQQFNGTGNGALHRVSDFVFEKVTCKKCLKKHQEEK